MNSEENNLEYHLNPKKGANKKVSEADKFRAAIQKVENLEDPENPEDVLALKEDISELEKNCYFSILKCLYDSKYNKLKAKPIARDIGKKIISPQLIYLKTYDFIDVDASGQRNHYNFLTQKGRLCIEKYLTAHETLLQITT